MNTDTVIDERPQLAPEPVSEDGRIVSEKEYWDSYYFESDFHYEWNDGRLEEKPVSDHATILVYEWIKELLRHFLRTHPIASLVALEMGFRLTLPTKTTIRKPDLGVVLAANSYPLLPTDCTFAGVFDLCIEALSDRTRHGIARDTVQKKAEYAAAGVSEYYIVHRDAERQAFYTLGAGGVYRPIQPIDGVIESLVLPGFRFRLRDLQALTEPEVLYQDPVYPFVLPGWRASDRRAEDEARRAEAESRRADQEREARAAAVRRAEAAERELAEFKARYGNLP